MSHGDELDRRRARRYAWAIADPDALGQPEAGAVEPTFSDLVAAHEGGEDEEEIEEDDEDDREDPAGDDWRRRAQEEVAILADGVDRVWAVTDVAQQAEAAAVLVGRAAEMGLTLAAIQHHPLQSVRLLRLAVRHLDRLPDDAVEAACGSALWLDYSHPETAELILDVVRSGNRRIEGAVLMALGTEREDRVLRSRDLPARLGRIIDEGPTWTARLVALHFVDVAGGGAVVPPLRRALRAPHLGVRWWALHHLNRLFPDALQEEDVLFLLEDAVVHPLPDDLAVEEEDVRRAVCYYPEEVTQATARLHPEGGDTPLARIVEGDCVHPQGFPRSTLGGEWALGVLAASYPGRAAPFIDRWLEASETWKRRAAVEAVVRLPLSDARPRLLRAAGDGAPTVSVRARDAWLDRCLDLCPADELTGAAVHLLDGEASERLRSRLLVLRGPRAAREAMVEVLLRETGPVAQPACPAERWTSGMLAAPVAQPACPAEPRSSAHAEALVALIFALADDVLVQQPSRPGLPKGREGWCREIFLRFGERGVAGLCALAARYPEGRVGWIWALHHLVAREAVSESGRDALRELAARRLAASAGDPEVDFDVVSLLQRLGAPPETHPRLWSIALDPAAESYMRGMAAAALASSSRDPALDASVAAEMRAGLEGHDLLRVARAAAIGLARKDPQAIALARCALEENAWTDHRDIAVVEALRACACGLRSAGALPEGWVLDALDRPETCAFTIVAAWHTRDAAPEARRSLQRALSSPVRDGAAAAEAASALLRLGVMGPRNRRLPAICQGAPLIARGELMGDLLYLKAPLGPFWPSLEELLTSGDHDVTSSVRDQIYALPWRRHRARLLAILPRVVDPEIRDTFELYLEILPEVEAYWQDGPTEVSQ